MGHLDLIERASKLFDKLVVLVGINAGKSPLFSLEERIEMIKESVKHLDNVIVDSSDGLIVEYARSNNISVLVRGVRAFQDFEYELQMALMNRRLAPEIETVFLMPKNEYSFVSSSLIKGLSSYNCDIDAYLPKAASEKFKERFRK